MRPPRLLLAGLVAGLLFGACSDPEPNIADPTPTPSPASTSPTAPPTSASPTAQPLRPVQTVRAWVRDWNEALATGDLTQLRAYNAAPCRNCESILALIGDVYAAGGRIEGGTWTPSSVKEAGKFEGSVIVTLAVESAPGTRVPSPGADPVEFVADKRFVRYFVKPDGQLSAIEFLS